MRWEIHFSSKLQPERCGCVPPPQQPVATGITTDEMNSDSPHPHCPRSVERPNRTDPRAMALMPHESLGVDETLAKRLAMPPRHGPRVVALSGCGAPTHALYTPVQGGGPPAAPGVHSPRWRVVASRPSVAPAPKPHAHVHTASPLHHSRLRLVGAACSRAMTSSSRRDVTQRQAVCPKAPPTIAARARTVRRPSSVPRARPCRCRWHLGRRSQGHGRRRTTGGRE